MPQIEKNRRLLRDNREDFKAIFGFDLVQFMSPFSGFDLITFDEKIIRSESHISCVDTVAQKYGQAGMRLIHTLIGKKE